MLNATCYLGYFKVWVSAKSVRNTLPVLLLLLVIWSLVSPTTISAFAGLGGYISEKVLSSGTSGTLTLGNSASGPTVIGSGPGISTLAATNVLLTSTGTTATLNGSLDSLNGMPQADIWFQYGNTPAMLQTTATTTVTGTGAIQAVITGYPAGTTMYYRFVSATDGTSYGATQTFKATDGTSYDLMWNILTTLIALSIFVTVLVLFGNPLLAIILTIVGLVAIFIVRALVNSAFGI